MMIPNGDSFASIYTCLKIHEGIDVFELTKRLNIILPCLTVHPR